MIHGHRSACQRVELIPLFTLFKFCLWEKRLLTPTSGDLRKHKVQEELETTLQSLPSLLSTVPGTGATSQRAIPQAENNLLTHVEITTQRKLGHFIH